MVNPQIYYFTIDYLLVYVPRIKRIFMSEVVMCFIFMVKVACFGIIFFYFPYHIIFLLFSLILCTGSFIMWKREKFVYISNWPKGKNYNKQQKSRELQNKTNNNN